MGKPPHRTATKLWLGVGAFALVAGSGLPAEAQATPPHQAPAATHGPGGERGHGGEAGEQGARAPATQGGEGGEGGERGSAGALAGASPEVAYAARLALIRGHLAIGRELLASGAGSEALPHFLHPKEEIYEDLEPQLRRLGAPEFEAELDALATAVRGRAAAGEIASRQAAVEAALERAGAALPAATRAQPGFVGDVLAVVLRQAADEYAEALEGGRIANAVEYQDGRGFLSAARAMLGAHAAALRAKDAKAFEEVEAALGRLAAAWPAAAPPARPALSAGEVSALVSRIELAAGDWH